jgi:glycine/D-amino acid oxidase-like deaminating enzyme
VLVATGAYTTSNFGYFRRRIIPVGSFIIATRPLTDAESAATMPGNRTCVNSMNIGNYFRLVAGQPIDLRRAGALLGHLRPALGRPSGAILREASAGSSRSSPKSRSTIAGVGWST